MQRVQHLPHLVRHVAPAWPANDTTTSARNAIVPRRGRKRLVRRLTWNDDVEQRELGVGIRDERGDMQEHEQQSEWPPPGESGETRTETLVPSSLVDVTRPTTTTTELASQAQMPNVRAEIHNHEMSVVSTCEMASSMCIPSVSILCRLHPSTHVRVYKTPNG